MAPVPAEPEVKYLPLSLVGGHAVTVAYSVFTVARSLYRSYQNLPPSQGTRRRLHRRSTLMPIFTSLALISLTLAGYWSFSYTKLSYRVWADQRGVQTPARFYGDNGVFPCSSENATPVFIARWLTDTPVHLDALEIVAEKARRFWWGQQIELATVSWSLLLAVEGRRRRIPSLWAYLALAHLVNLSFAQNLFYVALLLTPTPTRTKNEEQQAWIFGRLRDRIFPPKPTGWFPHPALFLASFCFTHVLIYWSPSTAGLANFASVAIFERILTFAPLIIPVVVPVSWGAISSDYHETYRVVVELFRFLSTASFVFHVKGTALGLLYNAPDAHYHRHSRFFPFDKESRSAWERTTTALGKVLGSASDHPVVAAVASDVLLSGVSQGLWAATRALDVNDILASSTPLAQKNTSVAQPPAELLAGNGSSTPNPEPESDSYDSSSSTRRRGLLAKAKSGRPHKLEAPAPKERCRTRGREATAESGKAAETAYEPNPAESLYDIEGDRLPDTDLDWESAALVWGLAALGGLGSSSAGIFGAECTSR